MLSALYMVFSVPVFTCTDAGVSKMHLKTVQEFFQFVFFLYKTVQAFSSSYFSLYKLPEKKSLACRVQKKAVPYFETASVNQIKTSGHKWITSP
jgi:hypothetical protein